MPQRNGCSSPPSLQQLGAIVYGITSPLCFFLLYLPFNPLALQIVLIVAVALLCFGFVLGGLLLMFLDPSDPRILKKRGQVRAANEAGVSQENLLWCTICVSFVDPTSLHCKYCDKCVVRLDHHCKYVNSCIGRRNYRQTIHFYAQYNFSICRRNARYIVVRVRE
ncbi:DHHC palmitoyltransferase-domain-containing protein [Gaertneriomyces semiglobifer]|nr:DHHC palmitoyltransferase-domain-containing protein [Gaertneriomyces semiglobifer]